MAYKILWYSIPALHDHTNGAAIHNKLLLEELANQGIEVKVLNATVADYPTGLKIFEHYAALIKEKDPEFDTKPYFQFTENKVEYIIAKTEGTSSNAVTTKDQGRIFDLYIQMLEKFQPDVVMGYSGDFFSAYLRTEAKARNIPVVYALCNGLHRSYSFKDCDLVFAPSEATAKLYRESDDINVVAVGNFIKEEQVIAKERNPKYITLINPTPEKGLAIFVRLADIFAQKHPEQRFLVVKSVGDYPTLVRALHYADGRPYITPDMQNPLANVDVAEHTNDIRLVYAVTKVLVAPSVWHESWGCVATEATFNNIPVLATNHGGLVEATREGGILLDPPASTLKDFYTVPNDEEIAPYVEALERLLNEDFTEQCQKAASYNKMEESVKRLLAHLVPLMEKGQKEKTPLTSSYFFSDKTMQLRAQALKQAGIVDPVEQRANSQDQVQTQTQAQTQELTNTETKINLEVKDTSQENTHSEAQADSQAEVQTEAKAGKHEGGLDILSPQTLEAQQKAEATPAKKQRAPRKKKAKTAE